MMPAVHDTIFIVSLILAPLFFLSTLYFRRKKRNIVQLWRKPSLVIYTIAAFVLNLVLFIGACFFFANEQVNGVSLLRLEAALMHDLAVDCMMGIVGISFIYLGLQNFFLQFISTEGIVTSGLIQFNDTTEQLLWSEIKDYYVRSDYPITYFTFLYINPTPNGEVYDRFTLSVPFYALPRFEALLDANLRREREIRLRTRTKQRYPSQN